MEKLYFYTFDVKVLPRTGHEGPDGEQMYSSTLPSSSALDGGGWWTPRLGRFSPGKDTVPIVQEAGWAPGPVRKGAKYLAPTAIRFPDRPTRSESLYRLRYPGPYVWCYYAILHFLLLELILLQYVLLYIEKDFLSVLITESTSLATYDKS